MVATNPASVFFFSGRFAVFSEKLRPAFRKAYFICSNYACTYVYVRVCVRKYIDPCMYVYIPFYISPVLHCKVSIDETARNSMKQHEIASELFETLPLFSKLHSKFCQHDGTSHVAAWQRPTLPVGGQPAA